MRLTFAVVLAFLGTTSGQFLSYQSSNQYQTTPEFNEEYVKYMRNVSEGWVVRMSNGAIEDCQKFQLIDGNDFRFTVNDANNVSRVLEDRYVTKLATLFRPAMIELQMIPGLLGADISGQLHLYPLVATPNVLAVANQGGTKMVLAPHKNVSYSEIIDVLKDHSFPTQDLMNITVRCETNASANANGFQRFLGFLSGWRNSPQGTPSFFLPVGGLSEPAVRTQVQNPQTIAHQTLSALQQTSLESQLVPAAKNIPSNQQAVPVLYASDGNGQPQAYVAGGYLQPSYRSNPDQISDYGIPNYYITA